MKNLIYAASLLLYTMTLLLYVLFKGNPLNYMCICWLIGHLFSAMANKIKDKLER